MHPDHMPVRLHHIVIDARDLTRLARFWTQALGWKVLSERENEIGSGKRRVSHGLPTHSSGLGAARIYSLVAVRS